MPHAIHHVDRFMARSTCLLPHFPTISERLPFRASADASLNKEATPPKWATVGSGREKTSIINKHCQAQESRAIAISVAPLAKSCSKYKLTGPARPIARSFLTLDRAFFIGVTRRIASTLSILVHPCQDALHLRFPRSVRAWISPGC